MAGELFMVMDGQPVRLLYVGSVCCLYDSVGSIDTLPAAHGNTEHASQGDLNIRSSSEANAASSSRKPPVLPGKGVISPNFGLTQ
jgi:hypothetical protein